MIETPVALVTGATRGIGREVALQLGKKGIKVIALGRTVGALESLDDEIRANGGQPVTLIPVDLKNLEAVATLGPQLFDAFGRLDYLIGNAGLLGGLSPVHQTKPDVWDSVFTVNVHANQRLIGTLDPLLRAAPKAKAVFVTSGAVTGCKPFWGAYAASKAALETFVKIYAKETEQTNIDVHLFDPGRVDTAMRAQAYPGEDKTKLDRPEDTARQIVDLCLSDTEDLLVRAA